MAELGHPNDHMLVLTDADGDQLLVYPVQKPNLVLVAIRDAPHAVVELDESQTRQLVEFLQQRLASRC